MSAKQIVTIMPIFIILILLVTLQSIPTTAAPTCAILPENMIGWWPANGDANDYLAKHHGTLGAEANFVSGKVREAFNLDGTDDFIRILDSDPDLQLDGLSELTIDAWVYPNTQLWQNTDGFINAIVSKYNTTIADGASYYLILFNGKLRVAVFQSVSPEIWAGLESNDDIPVNEWSHVAGVWKSGTSFELYVNGALVSGTPISGGSPDPTMMTMAKNNVPVNFGRVESFSGSSSVPSAFFHGLIDEAEVFNRALSASEIQAIYDAGSVGKCSQNTFLPFIISK